MRRSLFASRGVACLLLVTMAACTTWQPYAPPPDTDAEFPTRVRFTLESGQSIELKRPRLEGDSVYVGEVSPRRITRVPVSSVVSVEEGGVDIERTVFAVLGAVGLMAGFLALGVCGGSDLC